MRQAISGVTRCYAEDVELAAYQFKLERHPDYDGEPDDDAARWQRKVEHYCRAQRRAMQKQVAFAVAAGNILTFKIEGVLHKGDNEDSDVVFSCHMEAACPRDKWESGFDTLFGSVLNYLHALEAK